jgi:predicted membrane protein
MPLDDLERRMHKVDETVNRASSKGRASRSNIVFGLIVVAVGVLFLLHNFGFHSLEFWNFWPAAILLLGLSKVFGGRHDERTFGWVMLFIGSVFFARYTLGYDVSLGRFWPVIVIIVGVSIVIRAIVGPKAPRLPKDALDSSSTVNERALIGGITRKNTSQSFQGGELTAVMGGCEIDLREARMAGATAVIDCFTVWGGIVIQIPPDWAVDPQVSVLAAGFEDQSKPPVQPSGRLIVRGTAVMAGIEIKN